MIWTCKQNATKQTVMEKPRMGTRGRPNERRM